jgi:hypothetical protein
MSPSGAFLSENSRRVSNAAGILPPLSVPMKTKAYVIHNCGSADHSMAARPCEQLHDGRRYPHFAGDRHRDHLGQFHFRTQARMNFALTTISAL